MKTIMEIKKEISQRRLFLRVLLGFSLLSLFGAAAIHLLNTHSYTNIPEPDFTLIKCGLLGMGIFSLGFYAVIVDYLKENYIPF